MFTDSVIIATTIYAAAIAITAIGGLFSEKSGTVNIGLDGSMVAGALGYAFMGSKVDSVFLAFLIAILIGGLVAGLHAIASVKLKANQVISGTALNLFMPAIAIMVIRSMNRTNLSNPFLHYNVLGVINIYLVIAVIVGILSWFFLYKTALGLRFRAAGENPNALESVGISVNKYRYIGVILSGMLAGIGGAMYVSVTSAFHGHVQGAGFIALAILISGQWKISRILIFAFIFGYLKSYGETLNITAGISQYILNTIPYIATIVILIATSKNSIAPEAVGEQYEKSGR